MKLLVSSKLFISVQTMKALLLDTSLVVPYIGMNLLLKCFKLLDVRTKTLPTFSGALGKLCEIDYQDQEQVEFTQTQWPSKWHEF